MLTHGTLILAALIIIGCGFRAHAEDKMFEDFETNPATRWEYIADTVMGGVSSGQVSFETNGTDSFARLTGTVSTANRGGFIQFRRLLNDPVPADIGGIRLVVRGNGERYFVHLRTTGTLLPWQFYQSGFDAPGTWTEVRLPLSSFRASGSLLRATPSASTLTSVGVVAYGRDHEALLDVREIGFY